MSYLTELRLKEAEKLLKTTELKTYEIAERTGFSDYHHFCKTFKKVTGKTPSDTGAEKQTTGKTPVGLFLYRSEDMIR